MTCAVTIENPEIVRRSANWKPNVWDYEFLQSLRVDYTVMILFGSAQYPAWLCSMENVHISVLNFVFLFSNLVLELVGIPYPISWSMVLAN